ncbi:MAG: nucleotide 5'-monophosphate nucleosidase PpnN [Pseudomonadota bacterium]
MGKSSQSSEPTTANTGPAADKGNGRRQKVNTSVAPRGTLEVLSQREIEVLTSSSGSADHTEMFETFRRCALAVLNTGVEEDDASALFARHDDFRIDCTRRTRGLKLTLHNAPAAAFVEGRMIEGVREHLFSVLRDIVHVGTQIENTPRYDLSDSRGITDAVFHVLRHARVLDPDLRPNLVVCWGGHSISRHEYDYTKQVGYHLGLRGLDICTGCGPGAMKGPMKGASVGHSKQRHRSPRYIGLTEPQIIAAESPNPMVNHLVIMPDIEKRLEAFVRMGHGIVVFPGGAGTAEEILYLLGILMDPDNADIELPLIFTGPASSAAYFEQLDEMLVTVLGDEARRYYKVIVDDPLRVARRMARGIRDVRNQRRRTGDAFYFNWKLKIPEGHQLPFEVTHDSVRQLALSFDMPVHERAVNLRRIFSAIVCANVKAEGIELVRRDGPLEIRCEPTIASALDRLLQAFVEQGRMKLPGTTYVPSYRVVST